MIATLVQTCDACPAQWEGQMADGRRFYVRYRGGRLRIGFGADDGTALDAALNPVSPGIVLGDSLDGSISWDEVLPHFEKLSAL